MEILTMVVTILQLLCGLVIILAVLFQSGKSAGLSGAIGGVADSFLAKNKAKTMDAKLARATKWIGAVFLILTLVLLILQGRAA
ncbi:preprotein translocase subunit SecG [Oscillibacter sp. PC13]|uniref:preprotein translocase subunit SecG n=1 Tax=Oscillibacter sp. PC13 TaxID=1855299 RepID=UPI0008EEADB1|nr:preprotein translocase subunit SecG [Oscillibacter sp. PC13]SFP04209.1 preprotein translocase subunit SecG [Oscillibacter sp. PC13]